MTEDDARRRLASTPKALRDRLVASRNKLPPGALLAVGRLYEALHRRGERAVAPSRDVLAEACKSMASLSVLLRTLHQHARDEVCLAEGRALLSERYQELQRRVADPRSKPTRPRRTYPLAPLNWPQPWLTLLPSLAEAPLRPTSLTKHIEAINQCAGVAPCLTCSPRLGWLFGWELAKALKNRGRAHITIASYLASLVALGRHGGLPETQLDGLRRVQRSYQKKAGMDVKAKTPRIEAFAARGGYAEVIATIARFLDRADTKPDWSVAAGRARSTAALLIVTVNIPPRAGDIAVWRLGHEIVREPWGEWNLTWHQGKTSGMIDAGRLWPETAAILDIHLLGGRARSCADARYNDLRGLNWLRLGPGTPHSSWPSQKVRVALGIPLHDLRTLAADYLRDYDPTAAPGIVAALLGHRSMATGEAYRALCTDDAATRRWQAIRDDAAWDPVLARPRQRISR